VRTLKSASLTVTALNMLNTNGRLSRHHKSSILKLWFVSQGYPLFCLHWDCTVTLCLSQKMLNFATFETLLKTELKKIIMNEALFIKAFSSTNALQTQTVLHFSLKQIYATIIINNNQYTDKTDLTEYSLNWRNSDHKSIRKTNP